MKSAQEDRRLQVAKTRRFFHIFLQKLLWSDGHITFLPRFQQKSRESNGGKDHPGRPPNRLDKIITTGQGCSAGSELLSDAGKELSRFGSEEDEP